MTIIDNKNRPAACARQLAEDHFAVFPLAPRSKKPLKGSRGFKEATCDPDRVSEWFKSRPDLNVGVATGQRSGILVVDIDSRSGAEESLAQLEECHERLPETLTVDTGRGGGSRHLYYGIRHGITIRSGSGRLGPGIDVKCEGGYIVAPPSLHPDTGDEYRADTPDGLIHRERIVQAPNWLINLLIQKGAPEGSSSADLSIPEGSRNSTLTSIAGRFRSCGMSNGQIQTRLHTINAQRCFPPLDAEEVDRIAKSIARYPAGSSESEHKRPSRRISQADRLVQIGKAEAVLFHSSGGDDTEGFATICLDGHNETWPIRCLTFRRFLTRRFHQLHEKVPCAQAMQDALGVLHGCAQFEGEEIPVGVRLQEHEDQILLDLGDPHWRVVRVTAEGWSIVRSDELDVRFVRRPGQLALPEPKPGGRLEDLRAVLNVPDDHSWHLLVTWMLCALRPRGPYPILIVSGQQGSAKSTLCRFARSLIDPHKLSLRRPPKSEQDLMIGAEHNWVVSFDNLSGLEAGLADAICALASGSGFATRKLFTDDDEVLFSSARPIILNGIDDLATRPDLADRAFGLNLPAIDANQRAEECQLRAQYEALRPKTLGALLDAVSGAMRNRMSTALESKPRMADAAIWITAAEPSLGWPRGAGVRAMNENQAILAVQTVESSPLGLAILALMPETQLWKGTAQELSDQLEANRRSGEKNLNRARLTTPSAIGCEIRRLTPDLERLGIRVILSRESSRARRRIIQLEQLGDLLSSPSDTSEQIGRSNGCQMRSGSVGTGVRPADGADGSDTSAAVQSNQTSVAGSSRDPPTSAGTGSRSASSGAEDGPHRAGMEATHHRPPRGDRPGRAPSILMNTTSGRDSNGQ